MKKIKKYWLLAQLAKTVLWSRYWMLNAKDPRKRELCMIIFAFSSQFYHSMKPSWLPMITAPESLKR